MKSISQSHHPPSNSPFIHNQLYVKLTNHSIQHYHTQHMNCVNFDITAPHYQVSHSYWSQVSLFLLVVYDAALGTYYTQTCGSSKRDEKNRTFLNVTERRSVMRSVLGTLVGGCARISLSKSAQLFSIGFKVARGVVGLALRSCERRVALRVCGLGWVVVRCTC